MTCLAHSVDDDIEAIEKRIRSLRKRWDYEPTDIVLHDAKEICALAENLAFTLHMLSWEEEGVS